MHHHTSLLPINKCTKNPSRIASSGVAVPSDQPQHDHAMFSFTFWSPRTATPLKAKYYIFVR